MNHSLRVVFAGTPEFAAESLNALLGTNHHIVAVYTQPDRQSGRGKKIAMSPVKQVALEHDIPVEQPINFKEEATQHILAEYNADVMVVAAYGLLLPQTILDTPRLGCINVHGSLLPRWRGAAPIQRAIQAGDAETGITIMQMEAGLDTGPMMANAVTPITAQDTGSSLHDKLALQGGELLVEAMDLLVTEQAIFVEQDSELATYAHKLSKQEAFIDWTKPAETIERTVRAFNSWPVAQTHIAEQTVRIWEATIIEQSHKKTAGTILQADKNGLFIACLDNKALQINVLQLSGSRAMSARDVLNAPKNQQLLAVGTLCH